MSEYHFETHRPVSLLVEIGKGSVKILAADTTESYVEVTGRDAESVRVEQTGDQISVVAPKIRSGFLAGDGRLDVTVTVPTDSELVVRTGSAAITVDGVVSTSQLRSGSGNVHVDTFDGPSVVETGSGDIRIDEARGELRVKSGSGDVNIGSTAASTAVSTGSGDVELGTSAGPTVVKTGSGDLKVVDSRSDVSLTTGSGDLQVNAARRGRVTAKGASGDVRLGIPAGVPVWTDISTVSGAIRSNLRGAGQPEEGADHVEVRAKTVSGDIVLTEV
ncbi:DUF4097 family beta strand repeat-containing protein [Nocardioides sp. MAHUQ-72]|uniref:DUF4097 family beta strand repeat-containing protein n=1 Tax=unclassified Nocardioides TaxID=2615069 RepID=UPI0036143C0D